MNSLKRPLTDKIPISKLKGGLEKCKKQIQMLLDTSDALIKTEKYPSSISFIILAMEEFQKMRAIYQHIKNNTPISKHEWNNLTKHLYKLTTPYEEAIKTTKKLSSEKLKDLLNFRKKLGFEEGFDQHYFDEQQNQLMIQLLKKYNLVKQDCFYLNFKNNDWFSIFENYTKKQQKAIAYALRYQVKIMFYHTVFASHFTSINKTNEAKALKDNYATRIKKLNKERLRPEMKKIIYEGYRVLGINYPISQV